MLGAPTMESSFKGRTPVQPAAAYHHRGAGSQWPAAQSTSSCICCTSSNTSQQKSFMQTGTPPPQNGLQANCNQSNFYQDSQFINSRQKPKAGYLQQHVAAEWKPQGANQWKQRSRNILVPNRTAKPALPSSTTAASQPHQQRVNTGRCESSLTHNTQVIYHHCTGGNNTQQAPSYYHRPHSSISQSQQPRKGSHLKNTPIQQGPHVSSTGQRTQQHPAHRSPTFHPKKATTQSVKEKIISEIIQSLKSVFPVNQDVCSAANSSPLDRGVQSSIPSQPMPANSSNTHQSSVIIPGETLSEYILVISPTQDMADSSQRSPYVSHNALIVPMIDQNKSVGKELRNSQSAEAPPSTTEEDCAANSPPVHTNSKAVAVVQPLSQQSCRVCSSHQAFDASDASEKPVCAPELSSRLAGAMLEDQHDAQMTPPSDVPRSQSCESGDDPGASISKNGSGATVTWTIKELRKLIETEETAKQSCRGLPVDGRMKLWQLFTKTFGTFQARKDLCQLLIECKRFVNKHVTLDTVLAQLKPGVEKQRYHILSGNGLYTEPPFRSTWLNINEQLDDIDKEFGFPPCLRRTDIQRMDGQTHLLTAAGPNPQQTDSQVTGNHWKQAEPKLRESEVETRVESSPIQVAAPDDTDGDSPEPCYSFGIQVLSPEEAKWIYERSEFPEQQDEVGRVENQDWEGQPARDACRDVPDLSVALLNETDCPIEEVCCLSRLVGNIFESNAPLVKCQCGAEKPVKGVIDITESDDSDTEMMDVSGKSPCEVILSIRNKNGNPGNPGQWQPSTEDPPLYPKINGVYTCAGSESVQPMISAARDRNIEKPSDTETSNLISEGEDKKLSDVSSDSSVETKEQTPVRTKAGPPPDVRLTATREPDSKPETPADLPPFEESSWCKIANKVEVQRSNRPEGPVEAPVRTHLDANRDAAQLVLFGSGQSPGKTRKRKRHFPSEGAVCTLSRPPEVLSVPLRSMKRQFSGAPPAQERSAKNKIFEIWRKSFPVNSLKRREKKRQRSALSVRAEKAAAPEKKLLDPSLKPSEGSQCRMEPKCVSPGQSHLEKNSWKPQKQSTLSFLDFQEKYRKRKSRPSSWTDGHVCSLQQLQSLQADSFS